METKKTSYFCPIIEIVLLEKNDILLISNGTFDNNGDTYDEWEGVDL